MADKQSLGALEFLLIINRLIQMGFDFAARIAQGDMTKEEALEQWSKGAVDAAEQNERFDKLVGNG